MNDDVCGFLVLLLFQVLVGHLKELFHLFSDFEDFHCLLLEVLSDRTKSLDDILSILELLLNLTLTYQLCNVLKDDCCNLWRHSRTL